MSDPHKDPLAQLITLLSEVLADVRKGRLNALDRMTAEFETLYTALQASNFAEHDEMAYKSRLKTLNRLRAHLAQELNQVRSKTASELGKVTRGRRGLKAYQAVVADPDRGAKRGEG